LDVKTQVWNIMIKFKYLFAVALTAMSFGAASADWTLDSNIRDGVGAFDHNYKAGGMQQVSKAVGACYDIATALPPKSDDKLRRVQFCTSMDIAAFQVDNYFVTQKGFPATPYFVEQALFNRVNGTLAEWYPDNVRGQFVTDLANRVAVSLRQAPASGSSAGATGKAPVGKYSGQGEGKLSLDIKPATAGKYQVSLSTAAASAGGSRCGGSVDGLGTMTGDTLLLVVDKDAGHCEVHLKFNGARTRAEIEESGCSGYHGAACGFDGTVTKR
jgi:hypothetical protein